MGRRPADRLAHDQRPLRDGPREAFLPAGLSRATVLNPADGFYEWRRTNGAKQPYYIHMDDGRPFAFAGLWESWGKGGEGEVRTCTILTTGANALVGEIHERMPVIVAPDAYDVWLDPASDSDELTGLLVPFPEDGMEAYPVSRFVNSPSNNDPRCVEPAA